MAQLFGKFSLALSGPPSSSLAFLIPASAAVAKLELGDPKVDIGSF